LISIRSRKERRLWNLAGAAAVTGLMAYALFAQYVQGYEACPLCIFQRVAIMALGIVLLVAGAHAARGHGAKVYSVLGLLAAGIGATIAGRHVYVQSLPPDQVPECGPGLDYLWEVFPVSEVIEMVLTGSGECAEVNWVFLGLSMPAWVFLWFVALGALAVWANWKPLAR
jgi:disulfide bond formation protein DsbB